MSDEEVLDVRPRVVPRWVLVSGVVLGAAVIVWGVTRVTSGSEAHRTPAAASPSAAPSFSAASHTPGPFDARTMRDELLSYVFARAHDPDPGKDIIRTGGSNRACAIPPPDLSPRDRVRALVGDAFPAYTVLDLSRVIDRFAGLCVLDLRARAADGTVLVLVVAAPVEGTTRASPRFDAAQAVAGGSSTQFVRVSTRDNWVITVGTSGPPAGAPDRDALTTLAERPAVRW